MLNFEFEADRQFYINFSKELEAKQRNYLKDLRIVNLLTGDKYEIPFQPLVIAKNNYLNFVNRSKILQNEAIDNDKVAIFITPTLPSEYHKYKQHKHEKNRIIKNFKHNPDLTIHHGYEALNALHEAIYKDFHDKTNNNKKVSFKFIKAMESHDSLDIHAHMIYFVDRKFVENGEFKNHLKNVFGNIAYEELTETKTRYTKNTKSGMVEIEIIHDISRAVPYLLKYIRKNAKFQNMNEDYHLLNGWKKSNKIRSFTTSKVSIPRYLYDVAYKKANKYLNKELLNNNYNMLELIEDNINATVETIDKDKNEIKIKNFGDSDNNIQIYIRRLKYRELNEDKELVTRYKKLQTIVTVNYREIYNSDNYKVIDINYEIATSEAINKINDELLRKWCEKMGKDIADYY